MTTTADLDGGQDARDPGLLEEDTRDGARRGSDGDALPRRILGGASDDGQGQGQQATFDIAQLPTGGWPHQAPQAAAADADVAAQGFPGTATLGKGVGGYGLEDTRRWGAGHGGMADADAYLPRMRAWYYRHSI